MNEFVSPRVARLHLDIRSSQLPKRPSRSKMKSGIVWYAAYIFSFRFVLTSERVAGNIPSRS